MISISSGFFSLFYLKCLFAVRPWEAFSLGLEKLVEKCLFSQIQ